MDRRYNEGKPSTSYVTLLEYPGDEVITMRSEILIPLVARSSGIMILSEMGITDPCYDYDEATISRTCAISVLINDVKYIVS